MTVTNKAEEDKDDELVMIGMINEENDREKEALLNLMSLKGNGSSMFGKLMVGSTGL